VFLENRFEFGRDPKFKAIFQEDLSLAMATNKPAAFAIAKVHTLPVELMKPEHHQQDAQSQ